MKHFLVKGTTEGFKIQEDPDGDWVSAEEANELIQKYADDRDALERAVDLQREEIEALKAGNPHEDKIRATAHAGLSPLDCWGAAAFSALPQKTKNRVYVAHAEGVIAHDEAVTKRQNQLLEELKKGAEKAAEELLEDTPSVEELVVEEFKKDVQKKEDIKVMSEIMAECPECGEFPCPEHAVKSMDEEEPEAEGT